MWGSWEGRSWGDAGVLGGGPRENPMSLSSPNAEKFLAKKKLTDRPTEGLILSARSRIKNMIFVIW